MIDVASLRIRGIFDTSDIKKGMGELKKDAKGLQDSFNLGGKPSGMGPLGAPKGGSSGGVFGGMLGKLGIIAGASILTLGAVKGVLDTLRKLSPSLNATMTIFGKGLMLMLRPIGDFVSMVLRPFAIAFLHEGIKYYRWFLQNKDVFQKIADSIEDVIMEIPKALVGVTAYREIKKLPKVPEVSKSLGLDLHKWVEDTYGGWKEFTKHFIGAMIKGIKKQLHDADIHEMFGSWLEFAKHIADAIVKGVKNTLSISDFEEAFGSGLEFIKNVHDALIKGVKNALDDFDIDFGDWVKFIKHVHDALVKGIKDTLEGIAITFGSWIDFAKGVVNALIRGIKNAIESIDINFPKISLGDLKERAGFQHGGIVPGPSSQAVPIMAHGQELMIPENIWKNFRGGGPSEKHYHFDHITINSDIDIQTLAQRLAEYEEDYGRGYY